MQSSSLHVPHLNLFMHGVKSRLTIEQDLPIELDMEIIMENLKILGGK